MAGDKSEVESDELYSSWTLFIVCLLLILSLWTSYYLQIKRIRALHETVVSIFAGMFVGLLVRIGPASQIREMLTFKYTLFFNLLLPPIILNSGFELRQDYFFRNFGAILTFAFIGTFISAIGIGVIVYVYGFLGLESLNLTLLEALTFGSALSATDPVTILAIFQQYKVDPTLYSIIFGESLLNDAVSIVLYETLSHLKKSEELYKSHFLHGVGIFLLSFSSSMAIGVMFGLGCSLMLKHSSLALFPRIEACLVALIAYTSYFFTNGCNLSGIVGLLFCSITLKHYAYHTMSTRSQRTCKYLFSVLAQLSENFIFIYLGMNLFTLPAASSSSSSTVKPLLILVATLSVVATRYAAVFPLSKVINFSATRIMPRGIGMGVGRNGSSSREEPLPYQYQMMLFWAGLRGAVGVALAAGFTGGNAEYMRTTVLAVVLLTVVVFGGTTPRMMEIIGIRTNVEDGGASSDEEDEDPFATHSPTPMFSADDRANGKDGAYFDRPGVNPYSHHQQHSGQFDRGNPWITTSGLAVSPGPGSPHSSESDAGEAFPLASTSAARGRVSGVGAAVGAGGERADAQGRWFNALDERYLLPLFSNATASRSFHARKQARKSTRIALQGSRGTSPGGGASEVDGASRDVSDTEAGVGGGGGGRARRGGGGSGSPSGLQV